MVGEGFLVDKNDSIDNAVFHALRSLMANPDSFEWDMFYIGEAAELLEEFLKENKFEVCHPWHDENETICYLTDERCPYCKQFRCPLDGDESNG